MSRIQVNVGGVRIGGGAPISIQSMTNTDTRNAEATVKQILELENAGCEIVRSSVYDDRCVEVLPQIISKIHIPLVADMSSNILSKPVDVSKYGVIYAGAQKNMGPAGVTVVIVREDLLGSYPLEKYPVMLDWQTMANKGSMYNTPPTYGIYVLGLVLEWVEQMGGVKAMQERAEKRSAMLYDYLDSQDFYKAVAEKASRSHMNVTFRTGDDELDAKFAKESMAAGMSNLKGHRSVGGMRASIYNAMPIEGVEYLIDFMKKFAAENK